MVQSGVESTSPDSAAEPSAATLNGDAHPAEKAQPRVSGRPAGASRGQEHVLLRAVPFHRAAAALLLASSSSPLSGPPGLDHGLRGLWLPGPPGSGSLDRPWGSGRTSSQGRPCQPRLGLRPALGMLTAL